MKRIDVKPLSVNDCWKGRRYKTDKYKAYERRLLYTLKPFKMPPPPYEVWYTFGFSSAASDVDNPVKPFTDILQKKYGFNDKLIYKMHLSKEKVKKGCEFIAFKIKHLEQ